MGPIHVNRYSDATVGRLGKRRLRCLAALLAAGMLFAAFAGESSSSSAANSTPKPATISLWLAGLFAGETPGTPYRQWVNAQVQRFEKAYPGSKVNVTLLPTNNDQFSAQLQAAFTSGHVPDAMLLYSGGYTTPYIRALTSLNSYVNANPGLYNSISAWDLSCANLNCQGGKAQIYGIPLDFVSYGIFYNKSMFHKAGIASPPTTFPQLLADCTKLKKIGVIPIAYGDRDGYSTDNWVTWMYGSYMSSGDIARVNNRQLAYASPKMVKPLQQLIVRKTSIPDTEFGAQS